MYLYLFVENALSRLLNHYRFSQVHEFEKPQDEAALNLSFVFKKNVKILPETSEKLLYLTHIRDSFSSRYLFA